MRMPHLTVTLGALCISALTGFTALAPTPAAAAEEKPTSFNQFFIDIFNPDATKPTPQRKARPVKRSVSAKAKTDRQPAAAQVAPPAVDTAALRQAVQDSLAQNPALLRGVIADILRTDPAIRDMIAAAVPKSAAPPAVSTPLPPAPSGALDRNEIGKIVREYLIANPEVLQEAMAELEKRSQVAEAEKHKAAVKQHADAIFASKRQVTLGNPKGDVTVVEFFDYNCGYCKRAMEDMMVLLKDPNLKVVLKEFPVLGPSSVEAAQVAVAVRMQDPTGKKYLDFHRKLLSGRGQVDKAQAMAAAKDGGLDMARLEKDMASQEVRDTLQESFKLAEALGMNGTPSYVIGNDVVIGAVGIEALQEKVNTARCGKATC
jgi:protein-disulfide isomerase